MVKKITSADNGFYKHCLELTKPQGIRKHKEFILSGSDLILENKTFLEAHQKAELRTEDLPPLTSHKNQIIFSQELFKNLDGIATKAPLVLCDRPSLAKKNWGRRPEGLELLTPLGDPKNFGALVRSALAFGAKKVILLPGAVEPFHPQALKASAGAILRTNIEVSSELPPWDQVFVLDSTGKDLSQVIWPKDLYLAVGEEGPGWSLLGGGGQRIAIPCSSDVESLNATVAASIALYEWSRHNRQFG